MKTKTTRKISLGFTKEHKWAVINENILQEVQTLNSEFWLKKRRKNYFTERSDLRMLIKSHIQYRDQKIVTNSEENNVIIKQT